MKFQNQKIAILALSVLSAAALVACGGGGSGSPSSSSAVSISGVAATGAPLANATVTVKDKNGATRTATADANGAYTISDASSLVPPLVVRAQGTVGGETVTVYSVQSTALASNNVINITPATQAILEQAAADVGTNVFGDTSKIGSISSTDVTSANQALRAALTSALVAAGMSSDDASAIDFVKTQFTANSTKVDKVFDLFSIGSQNNSSARDLVIVDKSGGTPTVITTGTIPANITPITPPATTSLDLAALRNWANDFNTSMGNNKTGLTDLFHANFLHGGKNRSQLTGSLGADTRLKNFSILGCKPAANAELARCLVVGQSQSGGKFAMPFVYDTNAWKAYGNQFTFEFELAPKLQGWYLNNAGTATVNEFTSGVKLWTEGLNGSESSSTPTYQSVKVWYTTNSTAQTPTWNLLESLAIDPSCSATYMTVGSTCSNYVVIGDSIAQAVEDARAAGTFKVKVVPYTDSAYTNEASSAIFYTKTLGMSALMTGTGPRLEAQRAAAVTFDGPNTTTGVFNFSAVNASGFGLWINGNKVLEKHTAAEVAALNGTYTIPNNGNAVVFAWLAGNVNVGTNGGTGVAYEIHMKKPTP